MTVFNPELVLNHPEVGVEAAKTNDAASLPVSTADAASEPAIATLRLLGSLQDGTLRLKLPIPIDVNREDGNFVVRSSEIEEFGYGASVPEAIRDFQLTVIELYEELAGADNISHQLRSLKAKLESYIAGPNGS